MNRLAIALAMALPLATPVNATEGLAFVCTGYSAETVSSNGKENTHYSDEKAYSLVIDLDKNVVNFGDSITTASGDSLPINKLTDNYIWVQTTILTDPYWEGELDRYTGALHLFHRYYEHNTEDFYLNCKRAKPLF
jgi:hypothetical protein